MDAALTAQPGGHLAVALAGERARVDHLADENEELSVRQLRSRPALGEGDHHAVVVAHGGGFACVDRRARRRQDVAHSRAGTVELPRYLGRFLGGIWSRLFRAAARRISLSIVSSPIFRSASLSPAILRLQGPRLEPLDAASQELIAPCLEPVRLDPQLTAELIKAFAA